MDIYEKIDEIGEYIEQAKVLPVINQKLLDVDYIMRALEELYAAVPAEIKEARDVLKEQQKREEELEAHARELMEKTKNECERLMEVAQKESKRLVDGHEIRSMAEDQARKVQAEVLEDIERMRQETIAEIEELRRESIEKARMLEENALKKAREIKVGADRYAEDVLNHIDSTMNQINSVSKSGRKYFVDHREQDVLERAPLN